MAALLAFAYLVLFGSIVAYSAYDYLLHHTRLALATSYAYVNPLVRVFLGAIILGEPLTLLTLAAKIIILAARCCFRSSRRRLDKRSDALLFKYD